jgi:hypothetical protein
MASPYRSVFARGLRWLFYRCLRWLGTPLRDPHTGKLIARILILPWRGRLRILGLPDYQPIRITPRFIKPGLFQSIALEAELLSFPDEPSDIKNLSLNIRYSPGFCLTALLAHQSPDFIQSTLDRWVVCGQLPASLLLLHGGDKAHFDQLTHTPRSFLADPRLRTHNPRRDNQSLASAFNAIADNLGDHTHVLFAEYDLHPLGNLDTLFQNALDAMDKEQAHVLFPTVSRVDGTCQEVYLQQAQNPEFSALWQRLSIRTDPTPAFWALLPGSFWTADAIRAVAANPEPFPCYFEIYVPTLLHHLGYRIRPWTNCPMRIDGGGNLRPHLESLRQSGILAAHPVK